MLRYCFSLAVIVFLATSASVDAQVSENSFALNRSVRPSIFDARESVYLNEVNVNAVRHFTKLYGEANGEEWSPTPDGSRADFTDKGIIYHVDYNKAGNWMSTLRVYQQQFLAAELKELINAAYPGYSILTTNELSSAENLTYFIAIQNEKFLKTISVFDGEISLLKVYTRADK